MLKIQNVSFETASVERDDGLITFNLLTDWELESIEHAFALSPKIEEVYSDKIKTAYYTKKLQSLEVVSEEPRTVKAVVSISPVSDNTERNLKEQIKSIFYNVSIQAQDIDVYGGAVAELAKLVVREIDKLDATSEKVNVQDDAIADLAMFVSNSTDSLEDTKGDVDLLDGAVVDLAMQTALDDERISSEEERSEMHDDAIADLASGLFNYISELEYKVSVLSGEIVEEPIGGDE